MGSAVHARSLKGEAAEIRAMIVLEMIGYFSDAPAATLLFMATVLPDIKKEGFQ